MATDVLAIILDDTSQILGSEENFQWFLDAYSEPETSVVLISANEGIEMEISGEKRRNLNTRPTLSKHKTSFGPDEVIEWIGAALSTKKRDSQLFKANKAEPSLEIVLDIEPGKFPTLIDGLGRLDCEVRVVLRNQRPPGASGPSLRGRSKNKSAQQLRPDPIQNQPAPSPPRPVPQRQLAPQPQPVSQPQVVSGLQANAPRTVAGGSKLFNFASNILFILSAAALFRGLNSEMACDDKGYVLVAFALAVVAVFVKRWRLRTKICLLLALAVSIPILTTLDLPSFYQNVLAENSGQADFPSGLSTGKIVPSNEANLANSPVSAEDGSQSNFQTASMSNEGQRSVSAQSNQGQVRARQENLSSERVVERQVVKGQTIVGQISRSAQEDEFIYKTSETGKHHFALESSNELSSYYFAILTSAGRRLVFASSQRKGRTVELERGEEYLIKVGQFSGYTDYLITISQPKPIRTILGSTISGLLRYEEEADRYLYTARVSGFHQFEFRPLPSSDVFQFLIDDCRGSRVASRMIGSERQNCLAKLVAGETYEIRIEQWQGFPAYRIDIRLPSCFAK